MRHRFPALLCIAALLAACSSPMRPQEQMLPAMPDARGAAPAAIAGGGRLVVRVRVPSARVRADYIGPSTARISIDITGPTNFKKTASLKLGATGCKSKLMTLECTLNIPGLKACPSKKPCYTGSVSTFDAAKHVLSSDQKFKFTIGSGPTLIPLVLYGVPASVAVLPNAASILTGNQTSGFGEAKCVASPQTVSLTSMDADGNFIVGLGSPALSLTSGDASQLSVTTGATPGTFVLSPPAAPGYAYGNHTITLTATATPPKQSGKPAASTHVNVTYSGEICGTITEFTIPSGAGSGPFGIAVGPDGALWFAEALGDKIGRITPAGALGEFGGLTPSGEPATITTGPDNNLWFGELQASKIGKMTPSGTLVAEYPTLTPGSGSGVVIAGPDGNIWFLENSGDKVGSVTTNGVMQPEHNIPTASSSPQFITIGPDGAFWFAEDTGNRIGRVTTAGAVTDNDVIPTAASAPEGIATGSDGEIWFAENSGQKIGRLLPGALGDTFTSEYALQAGSGPELLTLGPDGNIWFTEGTGNRIGTITQGGKVTEYSIPTSSSTPIGIVTGPDGAVWFTEFGTGKIGRLR